MNETQASAGPTDNLQIGSAPAVRPAASPRRPAPESLETAKHEEQAGALVMSARMAYRKGRRDEARSLLQKAFALAPTDIGALELLGDIFLQEGEQEKAIAVFERGRKYHPEHLAFEEKTGLARLDLAEIEHDKIARKQFEEHGDLEGWQDRSPVASALLCLVLPGAGQLYNEEYERGAAFVAAFLVLGIAWYWPLHAALSAAPAATTGSELMQGMGSGLAGMSAFARLWVFVMLLLWNGLYAYSAWDAVNIARHGIEKRKRAIGIWT